MCKNLLQESFVHNNSSNKSDECDFIYFFIGFSLIMIFNYDIYLLFTFQGTVFSFPNHCDTFIFSNFCNTS